MSKLNNLLYEKAPELTDTEHIKVREAVKDLMLELIGEAWDDFTPSSDPSELIDWLRNKVDEL